MRSRVLLPSLAVVLASCTSENELSLPAPPAGYPTAYATRDCAPADGPAVRLYLAAEPSEALPPPAPFVDVVIWQGVNAISNKQFEWNDASNDGSARRCITADACESASRVIVRFRPTGADTTITGTVTLTFGDGSIVTGGFNAAWRPRTVLCG
jgi:hypothetical protein